MNQMQPPPLKEQGSNLTGLLDRVSDGLDEGLLPVEIFNDDEVFKVEMERIFAQTWVFVAHESEIPKNGDYVLRRIGLDPVIVTRDDDGKINVMSSYCRHRGTQVCLTDRGNATHFKCPYHGWTYKNNGDLAGVPHAKEAYGGPLDAKKWALQKAPRVDVYQGFIFASLAESGPTLKEHLGGAAWVLDTICGLHSKGMRVVGVPERYQVRADWKNGADNFAGDCYHVDTAHWSNEVTGYISGARENNNFARSLVLEGGHGFLCHALPQMIGPFAEYWGYAPHIKESFDFGSLDNNQREFAKDTPPTVGNIFPNLGYIRMPGSSAAGKPMAVYTSFRQWQPIAPGVMEMWNWQFTWDAMTEEDTEDAYLSGQYAFGSAGMFEQDDTVVWEGPPRIAQSVWARKTQTMFNYQQGTYSGVKIEPDPSWPGPGEFYQTGYGEYGQIGFYRQWLHLMNKET